MTKETADKVAKFNTTEGIQKWSSGVAKFAADAHPHLAAAASRACNECPFRNNLSMGGCISEECPIHMVRKALQLATKRVAASAKEIYKAKYRVNTAWK